MAQTIKLKRSGTSGATPTTSQLELGEVAINTYDGKMYIKKNVSGTESIVEIGGLSSVALGGLSDVTISSVAADQLLQYNGSEWVNVSIAEASAIMKEYQFTATSGQSTFSGSDDNSETLSYTAGAIQVFLNGIFLDSAVDYTATNGTSIVLSETVDANDYLQVVAFKKKIGDGNVSVDTFTGDDSTTAFTLSLDPGDENNTRVFIDGVYQSKSNYSVSGTTLTFSTAPPTSTAIEVEIGNRVVTLDTLSDLDLPDDVKLRLGTSQDLQIYHDGSNSYIKDTGTGSLAIQASQLNIDSSNGSEYQATFVENGAVSLYYDGSKKFETTNDGVTVTGDVEADEFIGDVRGAVLFKAQAGETLAKGEVVYISGISGNTTIVSKADADDASKMPAFGLVAAAASSGNPVDIYTNGILSDIDTSSYSEGDELFVSTTAGALTATAPTGESAALQKIGKVTRSNATSGSIFIVGAGRSNAVPNLDDGDIFIGNASNQAVTASLNTKIESYLDAGTSTPTFAGLATTANMTFGDNDKAIFGAGSDLQIYHTGTYSLIADTSGTGPLRVVTNTFQLNNAADTQNMIIAAEGGAVNLYHAGNAKLATTSTGIDVTGTVTADGLTVDAALATINAPSNNADLILTEGGTNTDARIRNSNGILEIDADLNNEFGNSSIMFAVDGTDRLKIDRTGDIEFYEDTGTTPKFHWDAANERLGLGTTTPTQSLDIRSSGSGAAIKLRREDTSDEMLILIGSSYGYVQNTTGPLGLGGSGGDRDLFIATSGNVGINNTNPNFSLDISGADNSQLRLLGTDTNPTTLVMDYNSGGATGRVRIQNDDGDLKFTTNNGNVRQTILENGNVGIGTDSPSQLLNIEGATNPAILVTDTTNTTSLLLRSQNNTSSVGTTSNHPLVLETTGTERMRIDSSGKVGIGTTVPNRSDFNIHGANRTLASTTSQVAITASDSIAANIGGSLHFGARYDTTTTDFAPTGYVAGRRENATVNNYAGYLQFGVTQGNAGTIEAMRIDSSGRVGIGETSPDGKLHIKGGTATDDASHVLFENTQGSKVFAIGGGASGVTNNNLFFRNVTDNTTPMVITDAGNVGIGTASPNEKLHVAGNIHGYAPSGINAGLFASTAAGATTVAIRSSGVTHFNGGNVGIGTTSPDSKLHISGVGNTNIKITAGANSSASLRLVNDAHDWDVNCQTTDTFAIYSHTDGVARLAILPTSGNVGIGTTSPQAKLHIEGDGTYASIRGYSQVLDLGNWTNGEVRIESTGAPFHLRAAGNQPLHLETDNVERVTVLGTGNVGIGTTSPDYKLEVVGDSLIGDATAVTSPVFGAQQQIVKSFTHGQYGIGRSGNLYLLNTNTSGEAGFLCFGGYSNHTNNLYYQTGGIGGGTEAQDGGSWGGYLNFWTTSDGTAGAASGQFEHMRITADGNVGIGTASPNAKLEIKGASSTNYLQFNNSSDTELFRIDSNFRWAWGTTAPEQDIDFRDTSGERCFALNRSTSSVRVGNVLSTHGHANADNFIVGDITGTATGLTIVGASGSSGNIHFSDGTSSGNANIQGQLVYAHSDNSMRFYTAVAEKFRIKSDGKVGINNTGAPHDLTIYNASGPTLYLVGGGYNDDVRIAFGGGDTTNTSSNGNTGAQIISTQSAVSGQARGDLRFLTNQGDSLQTRLVIEEAGNIGINNSNPDCELSVNGTISSGTTTKPTHATYDSNGNMRSFEHHFTVSKTPISTGTAANYTLVDISGLGNFHQASFVIEYGTRLQAVSDSTTGTVVRTYGVNRFNSGTLSLTETNAIAGSSNSLTHALVTVEVVSNTQYRLRVEFSSTVGGASFVSGVIRGYGVADYFPTISFSKGMAGS